MNRTINGSIYNSIHTNITSVLHLTNRKPLLSPNFSIGKVRTQVRRMSSTQNLYSGVKFVD